MSATLPEYQRGDHLKVRRPLGYFHHGIYLGGGKVAQFGGRVADKPGARVGVANLAEFERGGRSQKVKTYKPSRVSGLYFPKPDAPDKIVERAHWLVENYPAGRYNVLGNNCETMAAWCLYGRSPESLQARDMIYVVRLLVVYPFVLWYLPRLRQRGRISERQMIVTGVVVYAAHLTPTAIWAWHRWRFAKYITQEHPPTRALLDEEIRQGKRER